MEKEITVVWMWTKLTCSSIQAYKTYHGGLHVWSLVTVFLCLMGELLELCHTHSHVFYWTVWWNLKQCALYLGRLNSVWLLVVEQARGNPNQEGTEERRLSFFLFASVSQRRWCRFFLSSNGVPAVSNFAYIAGKILAFFAFSWKFFWTGIFPSILEV